MNLKYLIKNIIKVGIVLLLGDFILQGIFSRVSSHHISTLITAFTFIAKRLVAIPIILKVTNYKEIKNAKYLIGGVVWPGITLILLGLRSNNSQVNKVLNTPETGSRYKVPSERKIKLDHICWSFNLPRHSYLSEFRKELLDYNAEVNPNVIIDTETPFIPQKQATIQFEFYDERTEEDMFEEFEIRSYNSTGFTADEFLYEIHSYVTRLIPSDTELFFEGVLLHRTDIEKPVFMLLTAS